MRRRRGHGTRGGDARRVRARAPALPAADGGAAVAAENERRADVGNERTSATSCGGGRRKRGERARAPSPELLPADLQCQRRGCGRPGAAAELSDWAAYFAATAALRAWRDAAEASARRRDGGRSERRTPLRTPAPREIGARAAARAARAPPWTRPPALAAPRALELGFSEAYEAGAVTAAEPDARVTVSGWTRRFSWTTPEMRWRGAWYPATASVRCRRRARVCSRRRFSDPRSTFARVHASLRRRGRAARSPSRRARTCHVPIARGVEVRARGGRRRRGRAAGGIAPRGHAAAAAPLAPTRSCSRWRSAEVSSPAAREAPRAGRCAGSCARRSGSRARARARARRRSPGPAPPGARTRALFELAFSLETSACDGSDLAEGARARFRGRACVAEDSATLFRRRRGRPGRGHRAPAGAARWPDARRGLHALFSRREMAALVEAQRIGELARAPRAGGVFESALYARKKTADASFVPRKPARSRAVANEGALFMRRAEYLKLTGRSSDRTTARRARVARRGRAGGRDGARRRRRRRRRA